MRRPLANLTQRRKRAKAPQGYAGRPTALNRRHFYLFGHFRNGSIAKPGRPAASLRGHVPLLRRKAEVISVFRPRTITELMCPPLPRAVIFTLRKTSHESGARTQRLNGPAIKADVPNRAARAFGGGKAIENRTLTISAESFRGNGGCGVRLLEGRFSQNLREDKWHQAAPRGSGSTPWP